MHCRQTFMTSFPLYFTLGILLGTLTAELGGKVIIKCEKTGYSAEIEFKLKVAWLLIKMVSVIILGAIMKMLHWFLAIVFALFPLSFIQCCLILSYIDYNSSPMLVTFVLFTLVSIVFWVGGKRGKQLGPIGIERILQVNRFHVQSSFLWYQEYFSQEL